MPAPKAKAASKAKAQKPARAKQVAAVKRTARSSEKGTAKKSASAKKPSTASPKAKAIKKTKVVPKKATTPTANAERAPASSSKKTSPAAAVNKQTTKATVEKAGGRDLLAQIAESNPFSNPKTKEEADAILKTAAEIDALVARMEAKLATVHPSLKFNPGCSLGDLDKFERKLGESLPWSYKLFMMKHGGTEEGNPFLFSYDMADLARVGFMKAYMDSLCPRGKETAPQPYGFDGEDRTKGVFSDAMWDKRWVPICANDSVEQDSFYCIDLNPGPRGIRGQMVYADKECGSMSTKFNSFTQVLEHLVKGLETGKLTYDQAYTGIHNPELWES